MEQDKYINMALNDFLLKDTYQRLTKEEVKIIQKYIDSEIKETSEEIENDNEKIFLQRHANLTHVLSKFYLLIKVHKEEICGRPVSSFCGTKLEGPARWVDCQLQKIKIPTITPDSKLVVRNLHSLYQVPKETRIFSADVVAMYPSIDPIAGIETITKYLRYSKMNYQMTFQQIQSYKHLN